MAIRELPIAPTTLACIQMQPLMGDKAYNLAESLRLINSAADQGAELVVLPELCNTGYMFQTRTEAFALAEDVSTGTTIATWKQVAQERGIYLVAGFAERDGHLLYNSAAVIGPKGYLGTFRKVHLWGDEHLFFQPGNLGFPVFDTPFGRFGVMICYDQWFPESYRSLALQGADIACVATNWVPIPGQDVNQQAMATLIAMSSAHTNSLFVACADRVGEERGQPFIGQSLIAAPSGWPVAGPASATDIEILIASIDVAQARHGKRWNDFNQVVRDRRPDQYFTG